MPKPKIAMIGAGSVVFTLNLLGDIFSFPVMLAMCRDMEEVCPDATFLNYVNPMAMNTWAVSQATSIKTVGLCHSVQGTALQLAYYMGLPLGELTYRCAGINHMAFYLELQHKGKDVYPLLREAAQEPEICCKDPVRFELFKHLGYFVTESSEHNAEYNPYFIRRDRPDLIERFGVPIDELLQRYAAQSAWWEQVRAQLLDGTAEFTPELSHEYAALIIHAQETHTPRVIYGNVLNKSLISNLPQECCVEVPCLVDSNGIQPTVIGRMPPQLAALQMTNINVQSLVVEAVLTGKKEHVYHAAMLDPHTSAELTLDEIHSLVDDLFEAHGAIIPSMA